MIVYIVREGPLYVYPQAPMPTGDLKEIRGVYADPQQAWAAAVRLGVHNDYGRCIETWEVGGSTCVLRKWLLPGDI